MALNPTIFGDNPQQPSIAAEVYVPDQLIAGTLQLVTQKVTINKVGGGAVYPRGQVMGRITATGNWIPSISPPVSDGSQIPAGILVDQTDTTGGAQANSDVYIMGEFNSAALTFDASWSGTPTGLPAGNGILALSIAATASIIIKTTSAGLTQVPES